MLCRKANCKHSHPELCAASSCIPVRDPHCAKFHGRYREDKVTNGNLAGKTPGTRKNMNRGMRDFQRPAQGNGRRGVAPPNRTSSGRSNNKKVPPSSAPSTRPQPRAPALDRSRRELAEVKRELATIRELSLGAHTAALHLASPTGNTYSDVVKASARARPPLRSFATVFATALETALGSAGLRLASA